jgi:hypothetical protein
MDIQDCAPGSLSDATSIVVPPSGRIWLATFGNPPSGRALVSISPITGSERYLPGADPFPLAPDGTKVAVTENLFNPASGTSSPAPLRIVNTFTAAQRVIAPAAFYGGLTWSPDSRQLLASVVASAGGRRTLELIDIATGTIRILGDYQPGAFSPDGRLIAVFSASATATGPGAQPVTKLQVMDLSNGQVRDVDQGLFYTTTFSPDSTRLAYSTSTGLIVTDLPTGDRAVVAPTPQDEHVSWNTWSPNGRRLAYTVERPGTPTTRQLLLSDATANATPTMLGAIESPVLQSAGTLLWKEGGRLAAGLRVADMGTGLIRTFNPIPSRLRAHYSANPVQFLAGGKQLLYQVSGYGGGYRTVGLDGRNERRPFPCRVSDCWNKVLGSPFDDVINAEAGCYAFARDTIRCGAGHDIVIADRTATIARDCEVVRYTPK